jgi:hypothetical protein
MIPRAIPVAAPVIKPRMVRLVMEGVLPTKRKPANPIHKVQRTKRMFIRVLLANLQNHGPSPAPMLNKALRTFDSEALIT